MIENLDVIFGNKIEEFMNKRINKKCPSCNIDMSNVTEKDFKDKLSFKEYGISGLCQKCQDDVF